MKDVMFVSHKQQQCGVYQYGLNTINLIKDSTKYNFIYVETEDNKGLIEELQKYPYLSAIIYNYYPGTMGWLSQGILNERSKFVKQFIIKHETGTPKADGYIYVDPTVESSGNILGVGRPIPIYHRNKKENKVFTVGSFGFGFGNKGFPDIIKRINDEYDNAHIRFVIPFAYFGDSGGKSATNIAKICRQIEVKPGIQLDISHSFLDTASILDFLADSDINLFFYDLSYGRGPSSVIDYALAVRKPLGITKSHQFRHLQDAPIFVEDRTIQSIVDAGTEPLERYYTMWSKENLIKDYELYLDRLL